MPGGFAQSHAALADVRRVIRRLIRLLAVCSVVIHALSTAAEKPGSCPAHCSCYFGEDSAPTSPTAAVSALYASAQKTVDCERVTDVDATVKRLPVDLESISLRRGTLGSLMPVCCFERLKHLDLSFNRIDGIMAATEFLALVYLNLQGNRLKYLRTDEFTTFRALEVLNLDGNQIESVDAATFRLFRLKRLYLSNNRLSLLSEHVFRFTPMLERLDLSGNRLVYVHTMFYFSTRLQEVNLSGNRIVQLDTDALANLQRLETIDLSFNNLSAPPMVELMQPSRLTTVRLGGNPIRFLNDLSFHSSSVQHIDLSHSGQLRMVLSRSFANLPALRSINLSHSAALVYVSPGAVSQAPALRSLDLSASRLQTVGADLMRLNAPRLTLHVGGGNPLLCGCLNDEAAKTAGAAANSLRPPDPTCRRTAGEGGADSRLSVWTDRNCPPYGIVANDDGDGEDGVSVGVVGGWHNLHCVPRTPGDLVRWTLPTGEQLEPYQQFSARIWMTQEFLHFDFHRPTDAGVYTCEVSRRGDAAAGGRRHVRRVRLRVIAPNIVLSAVDVGAHHVSLAWNGTLTADSGQLDLWLVFYRRPRQLAAGGGQGDLSVGPVGATAQLPRIVTIPKDHQWRSYRVRRLEPTTNYTFCLSYRYNAGNETLYESCVEAETTEPTELGVTINLTAFTTLLVLSVLLCLMCGARGLHHRFYIWQEEKYRSRLQESISGQSFLSSADSLNQALGGASVTYENIPLSCSLYSASAASSRRSTPRGHLLLQLHQPQTHAQQPAQPLVQQTPTPVVAVADVNCHVADAAPPLSVSYADMAL